MVKLMDTALSIMILLIPTLPLKSCQTNLKYKCEMLFLCFVSNVPSLFKNANPVREYNNTWNTITCC
jgi:hypothetical protein